MDFADKKIKEGLELLIEKNLDEIKLKRVSGAEIDFKDRQLCRNSMELYEQKTTNYDNEKLEKYVSLYNCLVGSEYAIQLPEKPKIFS